MKHFESMVFSMLSKGLIYVVWLSGCFYGDRWGSVHGSVLDPSGQPYPGVLVTLLLHQKDSLTRSDTARTRQDGSFAFQIDGGLDNEMVTLRAGEEKTVSIVNLQSSWGGSPIVRVTFTLPKALGPPSRTDLKP